MSYLLDLFEREHAEFGDSEWNGEFASPITRAMVFAYTETLLQGWNCNSIEAMENMDIYEFHMLTEQVYGSILEVGYETAYAEFKAQYCLQDIVMANGLRQACKDMAAWTIDRATKAFVAHSGAAEFLATMKNRFEELLGEFKSVAYQMFGWLKEIWNRFSTWAEQTLSNLCGMAYHVLDGVVMAIVVVGVSTMLYAIEKLLLAIGLMSEEMNIAKIFLVSIGVLISGKVLLNPGATATAAHLANKLVCELVIFFPKWQWEKFFPRDRGGPFRNELDAVMHVNFNPIDLLTQMGNVLSKASASTVIETGRFFSAIEQIKKGYGTLKEIGQAIFRFFCTLTASLLGRKSQFLEDATALIGYDVAGWMKKCDALLRDAITGTAPADIVLLGYKLISQGNHIKQGLQQNTMKLSNLYSQQVFRLCDQLNKVVSSLDRAGDGGPRRRPFVVAFVGESRCGKSELRMQFEKHFLQENGFAQNDVYTKSRGDSFWTGYHHQAIASFDDLGASCNAGSSQTDEVQFIDLVSGSPLALNMAALEEKGTFFTSPLITYSSNFKTCSPHSGVQEKTAFNNRRDVVVGVSRNGNPYVPGDLSSAQDLCLLDSRTGEKLFDFVSTGEMSNKDVLFSYILDLYDQHTTKEVERIQALGSYKPKLTDQLCTIGTLLKSVNQFSSPLVGKIMAEHPKFYLLGVFQQRVWAVDTESFDEEGNQAVADVTHWFATTRDFQAVKVDGELMLTTMAMGCNNLIGLSDVAKTYFECMVSTPLVNIDLSINHDAVIDPSLIEEIEKCPKWFRVLVGSINENYYDTSRKKGLFSSVIDFAGEQLKKVYAADVAQWPLSIKILVGFTLATLFGGSIFSLFAKLTSCMAAKDTIADACLLVNSNGLPHKRSGAAEGARVMFRNRGVKPRYYYANSETLDGVFSGKEQAVENIMQKLLVEFCFPGKKFTCLQMPGPRVRMLRHYVEGYTSPVIIQVRYGDGRVLPHLFDPKSVKLSEGTEVCEYENVTLQVGRSNLYNLFEFDPLDACGESFNALIVGINANNEGTDEWAFMDKSVARITTQMTSLDCGTYINKIPKSIVYTGRNSSGDCGALVLARVGPDIKVVGVHVAGDRCLKSYACLLPFFPAPSDLEFDFVDPLPVANNLGPTLVHIGRLKKEVVVGMVTKTAYEETPKDWHLGEAIEKEPAILSQHDTRLVGKEFNPFDTGILKYAKPAKNLDEKLLEEAASALFENQKDVLGKIDDIMPLHEAINGYQDVDFCEALMMATSEGFPHVTHRKNGEKGKFRFFEGEPGCRTLLPGTEVERNYHHLVKTLPTEIPHLVCIENVKDEKLPLRKIYDKPRSRLFSVLPLEFNLYARQLFLPYMSALMSKRGELPMQVGVNPYSLEWDEIAKDLLSVNESLLCCDYSGFDGLLTAQLLLCIAKGINSVIGGSKENSQARINMLMALMSRTTICGFKVYEVSAGLPSGFAMTVILNSLLNELLLRYYYLKLTKNYPLYNLHFDKFIKVKIYGDDNLIAVHPHLSRIFSGSLLKALMADDDIVITDGTDKTLETLLPHHISEVDFLQRKFLLGEDGLWQGPLNKKSLVSQLQFVKTKNQSMTEAYLESAENVLREMYLHSVPLASEWRKKFLGLKWIKPADLPTLQAIKVFHAANRGKAPAEMADIELLVSPELVGAFCEVRLDFPLENLCPKISVSSMKAFREMRLKGTLPADYFPIFIGCGSNLAQREGMNIVYNVAHGRGLLPTVHWFRENVFRRGNVFKRLLSAWQEGKHLIFISPDQIVRSYVIAVAFLKASGILKALDGNAAIALAVQHCKSLNYLVQEGSDLFV